jgi:hypothetical protein
MKFAVLVAILAETLEERAIDIGQRAGAGVMTLLEARGVGATEKKTFFGFDLRGFSNGADLRPREKAFAGRDEGLDPGTGSREAVSWGRVHHADGAHCGH